jgi:uncharacterized protein YbjT (DUF2867 family)
MRRDFASNGQSNGMALVRVPGNQDTGREVPCGDIKMILVVGATSTLGGAVAAQLVASGQAVRASCRRPARMSAPIVVGVAVVPLDLMHPETFNRALDGVDVIFTSTQSLTARRRDAIQRVDIDGYKALISAAAERGIGRFIFTSAMGACPEHPVAFWRAKAEVERHLMASGLSYTILRPSAFMDLHAHQLIGESILKGKAARILGAGETRRNLVSIGDVATLATRAILTTDFAGQVVEIGGPDNLTDREIASLYARLAGVPLRIQALPPSVLAVLAAAATPIHGGVANLLRLPLTMDSWPGLTFDASGVAALIGRPPEALEDFARARMIAGAAS